MVNFERDRRFLYPTAGYVVACILLATYVFLPNDRNPAAFWLLFALTLPLSLPATVVSYILGVFLFGPEGISLRVFMLVVWVIVCGLQGALWWTIYRARTSDRA